MSKLELYKKVLDELSESMPKRSNAVKYSAVAKVLGLTPKTIRHRLSNPDTIKKEHILAVEMIAYRAGHVVSMERLLNDVHSAVAGGRRKVFSTLRDSAL
jgi:hypothetical protein